MAQKSVYVHESTSDPTVTDDSKNLAVQQGNFWRNTSTDEVFMCMDPTPGAAVWDRLGQAPTDSRELTRIQHADTIIASADVLTLNATPVTLVAAPGADTYLEFLGAYLFIDHAGTDYVAAAGEDLAISYTDESGDEVSMRVDSTLLEASADSQIWIPPIGASGAVGAIAMVANAPLVAHILTGEIATGDSPFKFRVFYREITKAAMEAIS